MLGNNSLKNDLYHTWNKDNERLAKSIMTKQTEKIFSNRWHTELETIAIEYKVTIEGKYINNIIKVENTNKIVNYLEKTEQNEKT